MERPQRMSAAYTRRSTAAISRFVGVRELLCHSQGRRTIAHSCPECDTEQGMPSRRSQRHSRDPAKSWPFANRAVCPPLLRYQGCDGAWLRCTDVGGGSIKLVAVQGTSGTHGRGQMQPIFPVTGEELDIDTPIERTSTIQDRYVKYSRAIALPSLLSGPDQREIPTRIFKPRWLTLRTTSTLTMDHVRRPRTVKRLHSNDMRQLGHAECGAKGFSACNEVNA